MVLTAYSALSPVSRAFCHRHPSEALASQELDASAPVENDPSRTSAANFAVMQNKAHNSPTW
jgi:hypothetical protein